jgi:polyhydroxyalkanoate synthesis regulator phasin
VVKLVLQIGARCNSGIEEAGGGLADEMVEHGDVWREESSMGKELLHEAEG